MMIRLRRKFLEFSRTRHFDSTEETASVTLRGENNYFRTTLNSSRK